MPSGISELRARLWRLAPPEAELAAAAHALYGRAPESDEWADLLDFVVTEWVDGRGRTVAERLGSEEGLEVLQRWPGEVRTALWVVDGHEAGQVLLRDLRDDSEMAVSVPTIVAAELPKKTVLRARVVPWGSGFVFFGEPGLYGTPGVIARLGLLDAWRQSPEPVLLAALADRRSLFARQHEQRRVFLDWFGQDLLVFDDAATMEAALDGFMTHLLTVDRGPGGSGPTRAETWTAKSGKPAERIEVQLGETLREGRPGLLFDEAEGACFLPQFGELRDHLHGRADHPDVFELYLTTPELPRVALRRAGPPEPVAARLRCELPDLAALLATPAVVTPNLLPEYDTATS